MRTYQHPIYQDNTMAIRAEYDEEKRVFDLMKKFLYMHGVQSSAQSCSCGVTLSDCSS